MNKKRYLIIIGIVAAAVALTILFYTMLANHRPAITGLAVEPERVLPSGSCQIVCNATDPDGDELSYGWSANGGGITGEGATVTWTAPSSVGSYNVTVMVIDSRGGGVTDYVIITVRTNRPPTINSLEAEAPWTTPSGSIQVTCNASDTDGDELSYEWSASGGDIIGTGPEVIWTAPEETGIYNATVVVTDGYGGSDTRTLPISVAPEQPPIIEALLVTAEHCYLKTYSWGYKVGKEQMYDIECVIADAGTELFYEWTCDGGEISGEGSLITWTAPNPSVSTDVTVTVIVSDIAGNMASKNVIFEVVSCSTCTFGSCAG
jgi:hypothetical protein